MKLIDLKDLRGHIGPTSIPITFDWWDILASLIMCFVTYPILRVVEKTL